MRASRSSVTDAVLVSGRLRISAQIGLCGAKNRQPAENILGARSPAVNPVGCIAEFVAMATRISGVAERWKQNNLKKALYRDAANVAGVFDPAMRAAVARIGARFGKPAAGKACKYFAESVDSGKNRV